MSPTDDKISCDGRKVLERFRSEVRRRHTERCYESEGARRRIRDQTHLTQCAGIHHVRRRDCIRRCVRSGAGERKHTRRQAVEGLQIERQASGRHGGNRAHSGVMSAALTGGRVKGYRTVRSLGGHAERIDMLANRVLAAVNAPIRPSSVTDVFAPTFTVASIRSKPNQPSGFVHVTLRTVSAFAVRAMTVPERRSLEALSKLVPPGCWLP